MDKIVLKIKHDRLHRQYIHVEQDVLRIGRAFHNDVILFDPYIHPDHMHLEKTENGWIAKNVSDNGEMQVNTQLGSTIALASGDKITIGKTTIRVFDRQHDVKPATPLTPHHPFLKLLAKPAIALTLFILLCLTAFINQHAKIYTPDGYAKQFVPVIFNIMTLFVWAIIWSIIGYWLKQRSYVRAQMSITFLWSLVKILCVLLVCYVSFFTSSEWIRQTGITLVEMVTLTGLIMMNLSLATRFSIKKRWALATSIMLLFTAISVLNHYKDSKSFSKRPPIAYTLQPFFSSIPDKESPASFLQDSKALFEEIE